MVVVPIAVAVASPKVHAPTPVVAFLSFPGVAGVVTLFERGTLQPPVAGRGAGSLTSFHACEAATPVAEAADKLYSSRMSAEAIASVAVPKTRHWKVLEAVQPNRQRRDIFPTEYRCNNVRSLESAMSRNGFQCIVYGYEPEPGYLSFSKIAYFFGIVHRRIAPKCLRPILFAFGRSPS